MAEGTEDVFVGGGMFGGHETKGRVLVVDDEPDVRKVVKMTLTKAGFDVIEAEDGEKAIAAIKKGENPLLLDVIISDIRMPKINGVEAINYFQENWPQWPPDLLKQGSWIIL
jgi:two-component system chemotaxis response regulator CheY